jgi:hypothetical protein
VGNQILTERGDLGRTEMFTQTDFGVRYKYRFGRDNRFTMIGTVDVLNLFGEHNVLAHVETASTTGVTGAQLGLTGSGLEQQGQYQRTNTSAAALARVALFPNQFYDSPSLFQGRRNLRFGFRMQF